MELKVQRAMKKFSVTTSLNPGRRRLLIVSSSPRYSRVTPTVVANHSVINFRPCSARNHLGISPLIALMKDQVDALNNQGVPATLSTVPWKLTRSDIDFIKPLGADIN